jgi:AraC family transcriptional regulator
MELFAFLDIVEGWRGLQRQPGTRSGMPHHNGASMLNNSLRTNSALRPRFNDRMPSERNGAFVPRIAILRSVDQHSGLDKQGEQSRHDLLRKPSDFHAGDVVDQAVEIFPSYAVARRRLAWNAMAIEVVQALTHDKIELRFRGPRHLLVAYEEGIRGNGETLIEGLPGSTQRDIKRKLAFVPAGHEYREWQEPRTRGRIVFFYFDPAKTPLAPSTGPEGTALAPRLFFEDSTLWETAVKMAALIENGAENRQYCEALGVVLAHELVRRNAGARRVEAPARGGLAGWQQRIVAAYIEDHIAEHIALATLARSVRLSTYHFCRAFKRSFGTPPHRYHNARRIERAKMLLAQPMHSVTQIALKVGFSETSSFTAAFRRGTGSTPTAYRRSLG